MESTTRIMRYSLLCIFTCLFFSCSSRDDAGDKKLPEPTVTTEPVETDETPEPELAPNNEAKTQGMNYLLPQKPRSKEDIPEYSKMQTYPKLEHGAVILVMNFEDDYAKVRTLTQLEGWMPKENLHPAATSDSQRYFEKRRFGEISTVLGVYEAPFIKLFNDMNTRERVEARCFKGDKVVILDETDEYVKVGTATGKEGWCMKGFVKFL